MSDATYYKVLNEDGTACNGGKGAWPLPNGKPGDWLRVEGHIIPCMNGLHLCTKPQLVEWLGPAIYTAELGELQVNDIVMDFDKVVVRTARLVERLDTWNERTARLFAADCVERVLHLNPDERCKNAIEVARRFANGKATKAELAAAGEVATAAREIAWSPAGEVAAAAREVAWSAAGEVATAAREVAWSARVACLVCCRGCREAEKQWQTERLFEYLARGGTGDE